MPSEPYQLILDASKWAAALPDAVLAVFYHEDNGRGHATRVRDAFCATFGLRRSDVPLVFFGGHEDWWRRGFMIDGDDPFRFGDECALGYTSKQAIRLCEVGRHDQAIVAERQAIARTQRAQAGP